MVLNIKSFSFWIVVFITSILLFLTVNFVWPDGKFRKQLIDGDGRGYYDYLPALFMYKTVDFKRVFEYEKANHPLEYTGHNFHKIKGIYINKFPVGTALMMLPFFLTAQVLAPLSGLPADGYSIPYQYAVALAALWWLWVGIFFLRKLLMTYKISETAILAVVLLLLTGTNLFHYAFVEVAFSHVYSFAAITAFLYFTRLMLRASRGRSSLWAAVFLGLAVLVRPVNILVLLATPALADNKEGFKKGIISVFGSVKSILLHTALFIVAFSPQMIINYLQTGNPIFYGYRGEGFYFLHPHMVAFLFGFKKGWFVYTPAMLLLFPAVFNLWRNNKFAFFGFVLFLCTLIYVFSSWWNWYYGDGFGMRPMVDYYGLFALVIALWISRLTAMWKNLMLFIVLLFSVVNVIQTYQYTKSIIDVSSMNKKAYQYVFLRTSSKYRHAIGQDDETFYGHLSQQPLLSSANYFETNPKGWTNSLHVDTSLFKSNSHSFVFNDSLLYGSCFTFYGDEHISQKRLYLKLSLFYYEPTVNATGKAFYVTDIRDSLNKLKFYKTFRIKKVPDKTVNTWRKSHIGIVLPRLDSGDRVKVYCWNKAKSKFNIDDFKVQLYAIY